jgi:hypothetical protein
MVYGGRRINLLTACVNTLYRQSQYLRSAPHEREQDIAALRAQGEVVRDRLLALADVFDGHDIDDLIADHAPFSPPVSACNRLYGAALFNTILIYVSRFSFS